MKVLVLGASGFIGSAVAAHLVERSFDVRAGARRPDAARRLMPAFDWVAADFRDLTTLDAWRPLLDDVDAVVNCVGALQDGAGESLKLAHEQGPSALFAACEAMGVGRLIHISAVGADEEAGTAYARSKRFTEKALQATKINWVIVRPSLVIGRAAYGGTALMRGLAALPLVIPLIGGAQTFRPVMVPDLAEAVVRLLGSAAPTRTTLEIAGSQALTLADVLRGFRGWLGLSSAPVIAVPRWLAWPAIKLGDLLGWMGWPSSLRTTSLRQMDYYVEGDAEQWVAATGIAPQTLGQFLSANPATSADRWFAKLYFVRPIAIAALSAFWLATGLISLGPGYSRAIAVLQTGGYGALSVPVEVGGALFDIVMGAALLVRPWTAMIATCMCVATAGYLLAGSLSLPQLWTDPLGPWLKVIPMIALCLFVAATQDRR
jgi:uncharacterized protein YbjT (DUF2867 family)